MKIEFELADDAYIIIFRRRDISSLEALHHLVSMACNDHCFESGIYGDAEFESFITNLRPRIKYAVLAGHVNGAPVVQWGTYAQIIKTLALNVA